MNEGSGVFVGGSGVEVGSPAGTVSVGTGVSVMVAVDGIVQVGIGVCPGKFVGGGTCVDGTMRSANSVINVTQIVPMTPISAAITTGSINLLLVDISFPISKFQVILPH